MTAQEVLKECKVEGNVVKLPDVVLDRKLYLEVKTKLELIGGKWKTGKVGGFVFSSDPTELLEEIADGAKRNLKKEFQFFGTPSGLADTLVKYADLKKHDSILEPSAGQGAIINAIHRKLPKNVVHYFELMDVNRIFLSKLENVQFEGENFLEFSNDYDGFHKTYDKIIANPPFSNNQDIEHIRNMYRVLSCGGRLVTIASKHWKLSNNKKETEFREWLDKVGYAEEEIPAGAFKESGTNISTIILIIDK